MSFIPRDQILPATVAAVAGLAILIGGGVWWIEKQAWEKTDNAFIQADTVQVSPQVSGYVVEVLVADNAPVEAGQVLARIDPTSFQARLDQAVANADALDAAVAAVDDKAALEQAVIAERAAGVSIAQAEAGRMEADLKRYRELAGQGWVSDQKLQTVRAGAAQSQAGVTQAQAALEAERRSAASLGSARAQTVAQAQAARAAVVQARIDLERTIIRAPAAGVVGARAVDEGAQARARHEATVGRGRDHVADLRGVRPAGGSLDAHAQAGLRHVALHRRRRDLDVHPGAHHPLEHRHRGDARDQVVTDQQGAGPLAFGRDESPAPDREVDGHMSPSSVSACATPSSEMPWPVRVIT
jgi:multidrug efflux pump subunit AcrA (membrane-fusion protein)